VNRSDKDRLDKIVKLGCIVADECCGGRVTIHHVRRLGEKRKHSKVIGLCQNHHQDGGHGVAVHAGKKTWRKNYGEEEELLHRTAILLGE
tara:strand:+ start:2504 stop:2773 length:270 start_codon:yes stop_codon:yes gene_type:complete